MKEKNEDEIYKQKLIEEYEKERAAKFGKEVSNEFDNLIVHQIAKWKKALGKSQWCNLPNEKSLSGIWISWHD